MSVLVRALPTKDPKLLHAYVKGAPETIKKLCLPQTSEWVGSTLYTCIPESCDLIGAMYHERGIMFLGGGGEGRGEKGDIRTLIYNVHVRVCATCNISVYVVDCYSV